jgi:DNA adenine methylase
MRNPIRYAGGKTKAIKLISPHIKTDKLVSPFFGGGSLEISLARSGVKVQGYDIFDILVNFWDYQLNNPERIYEILKEIEPTKTEYNRIKLLLKSWDKTQEGIFSKLKTRYYDEEPIEIDDDYGAAYYWYNFSLSYGPMFLGWVSNTYLEKDKYMRMIDNVRNWKCKNLKVNLGSFDETIPHHSKDFLYLDPPYYLEKDTDNKMFKGIYPNPNFDVHHTGFDHEKLRDLLHNHKGSFVLSYNNCETIRDWYKDFDFYYPEWKYSLSNGETRKQNNKSKESHELLIVKK